MAVAETALDRFDADSREADLDHAIDLLLEATRCVEHHPDLPLCWYWLSHAYRERAQRDGALDDFTSSIEWARRLTDGTDPAGPERDELAVHLLDMVWDRSWTLHYDHECTDAADIDGVVAHMDAVVVSGSHPIVTDYVRLMRGAARLERYNRSRSNPDRSDLDRGIGEVVAARAALLAQPYDAWVSDGRLALVESLLSGAALVRFELDGALDDLADLDCAVSAARAAVDRSARSPHAALCLADAVHTRWRTAERPDDLDAAIDALTAVQALPIDDGVGLDLAELLRERAVRNGDIRDARRSAALLDDADPDSWFVSYEAGRTHRLVWDLGQDVTALDAAVAHQDRAIALDPDPGDELLSVYFERLTLEDARGGAGRLSTPSTADHGQSPYRSLVVAAADAFARSPHADPDLRARFAAVLGWSQFMLVGHDQGTYDLAQTLELLTLGATVRDDPQLSALVELGLGMCDVVEGLSGGGIGAGAVERIARLASSEHLSEASRGVVNLWLAAAMNFRGRVTGDRLATGIGSAEWRRFGQDDALFSLFAQFDDRIVSGDAAGAAEVVAAAAPALDQVNDASLDKSTVDFMRNFVGLAEPLTSPPVVLPSLDDIPPGHVGLLRLVNATTAAAALNVQGTARNDARLLSEVARYTAELLDLLPEGELRLGIGTRLTAGSSRRHLARLGIRRAEHAAAAVRYLTEALSLAGDHRYTLWVFLAENCAAAVRLTDEPDRARSRELGWSMLRADAWQVFLQSGTDRALAAARSAAEHARMVAEWCIEDSAHDDLVGILDAGRALALRAASSSREVADRLVERGHPELAAEWLATRGVGRDRLTGVPLAAGGEPAFVVPDELRYAVLDALGGEGEVVGLRPVTVAEIRAALAATGTDALVQLIAGVGETPGRAVIVQGDGDPMIRTLPALVDAEVRARGNPHPGVRDLKAVGGQRSAPDLDRLCAWAWTAAMDDVLGVTRRTASRPTSRPTRLVLVPFGPLAAVPWHAACTTEDGRRRYALDAAVISYSPSVRMFCEGRAWTSAPVCSSLVVGDPGGDLASASVEAKALHDRFYPDGQYLGRDATPGDVLAWIDATPPGPSVLHFACHATVDAERPTEAHLLLGHGSRLSAGTLLEHSRSAALDLEQVFLAACTTGATRSDHDEVLSLATSFLAAGARTVFGSLWAVPDTETSFLMYMVHRYLRIDGDRPADALRRAQLWMRSPVRADLPPELRELCPPDAAFSPLAWAGFTHYGR